MSLGQQGRLTGITLIDGERFYEHRTWKVTVLHQEGDSAILGDVPIDECARFEHFKLTVGRRHSFHKRGNTLGNPIGGTLALYPLMA